MNRFQLSLKSEYRYLYFLAFIALCQLFVPLAGAYVAFCSGLSVIFAFCMLYNMWTKETKENTPRIAYREFIAAFGKTVKPKPEPVNYFRLPQKVHA